MILWWLLILNILTVQATPVVKPNTGADESYQMQALDCRNPRKVSSGLLSEVCETKDGEHLAEKDVHVDIFQVSDKQVIKGFRCEKRTTEFDLYCGAYSHMKFFEPPKIQVHSDFSVEACENAVRMKQYVKENGNQIQLRVNEEVQYRHIAHGHITPDTTNVQCEGAKISINGELHEGAVVLTTTTLLVKSIQVEIDPENVIDLDKSVQLPYACSKDFKCKTGPISYILDPPRTTCPLYHVRSLPMKEVKVATAKGNRKAIVSHDHKIMLTLEDMKRVPASCTGLHTVHTTDYDQIQVLVTELNGVARVNTKELIPSVMDLDLESRVTDEYISYKVEQTVQDKMKMVVESLCNMNRHTLVHAELSPFHPGSLIRVQGEILQELSCTPVTVDVRIGDKRSELCYTNALPAWLGSEPVLVQAETRVITEPIELSTAACTDQYSAVFITDDGTLVRAMPAIEKVKLTLDHLGLGYLHQLTDSEIHESFGKSLLYTSEEITAFNNLLHFSRIKSNIVNAMTNKYCQQGNCGSYVPTGSDSSFDLSNLENRIEESYNIWKKVKSEIRNIGSYGGFIVLVIYGILLLNKARIVLKLYFYHKMPIKDSFSMTFNLTTAIRESLAKGEHGYQQPSRQQPQQGQRSERNSPNVQITEDAQGSLLNESRDSPNPSTSLAVYPLRTFR